MSSAHRHTTHSHEHDHEPQRGLPELLPSGERLLWQDSPDWRALAVHAFHLRKLVVYFGALILLRLALQLADGDTVGTVLTSSLLPLSVATLGIGLVALLAWLTARTAVYTITDKRVVMRVGIVLTMTYNLPFKRIAAANLREYTNGRGDLPLTLAGADRIALLHLWPHARPWRLARPEPMLRCVPNAKATARLLSDAWSAATGLQASAATSAARAPQASSAQPALAGH
jgi:hypothetical protein